MTKLGSNMTNNVSHFAAKFDHISSNTFGLPKPFRVIEVIKLHDIGNAFTSAAPNSLKKSQCHSLSHTSFIHKQVNMEY